MDGASRRIAADRGRRAPQRTRRSAKNSGAEGEQRRLLQLAVSVALFLLVYIGRGVFPAQLEAWRTAASANVDLKAAFQRFGTDLSQGEPVQTALEALCITLMGGEVEEAPSSPPDVSQRPVTLLSQSPGGGLAYVHDNGFLAGGGFVQKGDEPVRAQPDPEPVPSESVPPQAVPSTGTAVSLRPSS